jgi:uncharacterized phiE125 gp8 family phage protein
MKRILLEGPAVEPVLLAEAKAHLRLDGSAEDDLVGALIVAARVAVETEIRRVLIAQSWRAIIDDWPAGGPLALPLQPAISVEALRWVDPSGAAIELDPENYEFDAADSSVILDRVVGAVRYEVDFTAGYGATGADVPQPLRQAIRLLVTHWYENRSAVVLGEDASATPLGFRELVAPYRRMALC